MHAPSAGAIGPPASPGYTLFIPRHPLLPTPQPLPPRFRDEVGAAEAYDRAATLLLGPSAVLNFQEKHQDTNAMMQTALTLHKVLGTDAPEAVQRLVFASFAHRRGLGVQRLRQWQLQGMAAAQQWQRSQQAAAAAPQGTAVVYGSKDRT